ncbi:MAG: nickel pincer cofactor biosynthesis protein LarC [Nitrososphaeria archaeon]
MSKADKIAVIDCQVAGISGDMFLGALLDLGASKGKVVDAIKSLETVVHGCKKIEVNIEQVGRREFRATKIGTLAEGVSEMRGKDIIDVVEKGVAALNLSDKAKRFASNVVRTLVNAEAKLHNRRVTDVHLHEAGTMDTPAEIVGSTVALEDLGFFSYEIYSTPVSVGGGIFKFSHGIVSSPAPATLEVLQSRRFPLQGGPVESELATPTGVSLLVNIVDKVSPFYPAIVPLKIGYGAGAKDFKEMPNVLRITLGEAFALNLYQDKITVLETNLDDATGEVVGYVVDKLLLEGAKDVCVIPMFTKKNRPGQILKVMTDKEDVEHLSRVLIEETGSLGVRLYPCERRILARDLTTLEVIIDDHKELIRVKVAKDGEGKIVKIKPEYDDLKQLADRLGKPLRVIMDTVECEARRKLLGG